MSDILSSIVNIVVYLGS